MKTLLTKSDLTLEKAIDISVAMEMASKEAQPLQATGKVHKLSNSSQDAQSPCFHCSKSGNLVSACWCKDMDRRNFGKTGHVEQACRNTKAKKHMEPLL